MTRSDVDKQPSGEPRACSRSRHTCSVCSALIATSTISSPKRSTSASSNTAWTIRSATPTESAPELGHNAPLARQPDDVPVPDMAPVGQGQPVGFRGAGHALWGRDNVAEVITCQSTVDVFGALRDAIDDVGCRVAV